ncbi:MAG: hypothetical protein ACUBOA_06130 [Candidatus Loosdrechtia sp.]|uniref:hypothetical protein n=1 Tax=Candidatus Loosdrechtia sp. TaxID=3101272 RepID=UPI003A6583F5|nr:MAG: hypothetical protein QY305_09150 [Candidatus Jettenia sp. AMX2]
MAYIVIEANTPANAKVADVKKARGWGGKGEISVVVSLTTAVDDTEIFLSATQTGRDADGPEVQLPRVQ